MSPNMIPTAFAVSVLVSSAFATLLPNPSCPYQFSPFTYSGCYLDNVDGVRSFPFKSDADSASMTVEKCQAICKGNNYRYSGLEYYGECYCGSSLSAASAPTAECNTPCNGASAQTCGGSDRLSVYRDPTFLDVDGIATASDYSPVGCYSEPPVGRTLMQQLTIDSASLTTEKCLTACGSQGYPYAGTQFGGECWCGTFLGAGAAKVDSSSCSMPCYGDSSQTCGGPGLLNLYSAPVLDSSSLCTPPTVSSSSSVSSSTSSTVSIPSNTYSPPCTPTPPPSSTTSTPSAAPTSSCVCATPSAYAGTKAIGGYPLPCVGCNDNTSQRSQKPFKLFNSRNFGQCSTYGKDRANDACLDACKTQYTWCLSYADSCRNGRKQDNYNGALIKCKLQYAECAKVNDRVRVDQRCDSNGGDNKAKSPEWYDWCRKWLGQWV